MSERDPQESAQPATSSQSTYRLILEYANTRPDWERDVMRRHVDGGELSSDDYAAALAMCKSAHGLEVEAPPEPTPLAAEHLPSMGTATTAVTLSSLHSFTGVNALAENEELQFARTGLTTIYGLNGAGKSGYARVLKHLCRARGSQAPILPNQFAPRASAPAAGVAYLRGTDAHSWNGSVGVDANAAPEPLSQIMVHDSESATAYFSKDQAVEVMPAGLDILMSLKDALDRVKEALEKENARDVRTETFPELPAGTESGQFLAKLSADTGDDEIEKATRWTKEEEDALSLARTKAAELQAGNTEKKAREFTRKANRLSGLSKHLDDLAIGVNEAVETRVAALVAGIESATAAYESLRNQAFDAGQLPGTGSSLWQELWKAAAQFSFEEAYPEKGFPHTDEGAHCVLCQQELDERSQKRMANFSAFMEGAAARALSHVRGDVDQAAKELNSALPPEQIFPQPLRDEVHEIDELLPGRIDAFMEAAATRRGALLRVLRRQLPFESLPSVTTFSTAVLDGAAATAHAEAEALAGQSDTKASAQVTKLRDELEARKRLHDAAKTLRSETERLRRTTRRAKAIKACQTTSVSTQLGSLTKRFVTDALVKSFNEELRALGGRKLRVALEKSSTRKGVSHTRLVLRESVGDAALPRLVFSEGERRIVSLAAFLAELSVNSSDSAVVLDDPATSLDHRHREQIAERLVKESETRQVIVFTHDLAFLHLLRTADERRRRRSPNPKAKEDRVLFIERFGDTPGHCSKPLPWEFMKLQDRIGQLKAVASGPLAKVQKTAPESEYRDSVCSHYGKLRKTWERAIEESLFGGTVTRFGASVQTQRLKNIDLTSDDIAAVYEGMERCNPWAHDNPDAGHNPVPDPVKVAVDTNLLLAWLIRVRKRRIEAGLGDGTVPKVKEIPIPSA